MSIFYYGSCDYRLSLLKSNSIGKSDSIMIRCTGTCYMILVSKFVLDLYVIPTVSGKKYGKNRKQFRS